MEISIPVIAILDDKKLDKILRLLAGKDGLNKKYIMKSQINRPGLLLSGYESFFHEDRIQIFGKTEVNYLNDIGNEKSRAALERFFRYNIPCIIVSAGQAIPSIFIELANKTSIPLFSTEEETEYLVTQLQDFLEERIAPMTSVHGVLVDMYGVGVLIQGSSGIGKSETALELIQRGHRLVADDIVDIRRLPGPRLIGEGSEVIRHHMEIRGLGIINVKQIFGVGAIREKKKIELIVKLEEWKEASNYDRLGLDDMSVELLGVEVPYLLIPVKPGRNLSVIIEVGAMNQRLKYQGYHSAVEFNKRLLTWINNNNQKKDNI